MTPNLSRLLRPTSIAVFGGGWAANVIEQLLKAGFDGDIWPVHPTHAKVHGVKAYPSLDALPSAPDAAWVGVNRDATIDLVRTLRKMEAGGAVCFASGFRETTDGEDRNIPQFILNPYQDHSPHLKVCGSSMLGCSQN